MQFTPNDFFAEPIAKAALYEQNTKKWYGTKSCGPKHTRGAQDQYLAHGDVQPHMRNAFGKTKLRRLPTLYQFDLKFSHASQMPVN